MWHENTGVKYHMDNEERYQKVNILKEKINVLDNEIKNLNIERTYLQKLQKERDRLQKIKQTMDIFANVPELKKTLKSFIDTKGKDISLKEVSLEKDKAKVKEMQNSKNDILIFLTWIIMAISVVIIIFAFLPWIEINGSKINLLEINSAINEFFSAFGSGTSEEIQQIQAILWVINIAIWACAAFYGFAIYKLCRRERTDSIYFGMIYLIILIIIFFLVMWGINEQIKQAFWDFSVIRLQLSNFAWIALILACLNSATYYLKKYISEGSDFDHEDKYNQKVVSNTETYKFTITNYCLWTTLNLLSVNFIKQDDTLYMSFDYIANSYISDSEKMERGDMKISFGVKVETEEGIYNIDKGIYKINHIGKFGETSKVCLAYFPFEIEKIKRVLIYGIEENFAGKRKSYKNVYIDSELTSKELMGYRKEIKYDGALCKQKEIGQGWICSCGLYHEKEEESCRYCGMTIKRG